MKKFLILTSVLLLSVAAQAQMVFHDGDLASALKKAKEEGKMVFIDCYTSWCGPCKMLAAKVFPDKEVGDFMNAKFINLKVDMEKGEGVN